MYGPDVFAVLTPWREQYWANTIQAFGHPHNATWLDREAIGSREPTPALSSTSESEPDPVNRLVLKFEHLIYSNEIRFGTDEKVSHILLKFPGVKAISARQFVIVVRPDYTVYLEDRFSSYGTSVMRDGQVKEQAAHGEYILAGQSGLPKRWNDVVIVTGNLAYTIEFPNHAPGSSEYLKELETFRERENVQLPLFNSLGLHSKPATVALSQPFTVHGKERLIYLDIRKLASSSVGTVRLVLNKRDRKYYVKKTITSYPRLPQAGKKRKRDEEAKKAEEKEKEAHDTWFKNFRSRMKLLQTIDHPNILRVIDYEEAPDPYYIMPYYKYGTLGDLHKAGLDEETFPKIFLQLLLGLREFHKLGCAHRDLKEQNILVGDDFTLIFGDPDFVKSENDNALKTICGSGLYAAPEIWHGRSRSYGVSVDIWSLAICVLRLFNNLEEPSDSFPALFEEERLKAWNSKWYEAVFKQLDELDENNDQIIDIVKNMLKLDPKERFTADQCLRKGCENGLFRENRFGDIVLAEATEINTPTGSFFPDFGLNDGAKKPNLQSSLSGGQANDWEIYDNLIPTTELPDENSGRDEVERTPTGHSPSTSENARSGRPACQQKVSSPNTSDWSWTVGLEYSSPESGSALEGQPTKGNKEDLSKLRIKKDAFSSVSESSFSSRERKDSANPDLLAR